MISMIISLIYKVYLFIPYILDYFYSTKKDLCTDIHQFRLIFDYLPQTLATLYAHHQLVDLPFQQSKLSFILHALIDALAHLQNLRISHQAIRPDTIFIAKYQLKIANPQLLSFRPSYQTLILQENKNYSGFYLAPEIFKNIDQAYKLNPYKSDVFSVGICLLQCVLFTQMDILYDFKEMKFDYEELDKQIKLLNQSSYSQDFCYKLASMLQINPEFRPDFIQLKQGQRKNVKVVQSSKLLQSHQKLESTEFSDFEKKINDLKIDILNKKKKVNENNYVPDQLNHQVILVTSQLLNTKNYDDGSKYDGEIINDKKHGEGQYKFKNGAQYVGSWKYDKMDGKGKLYYASGKLAYDGEWKDNMFHGYGVLFNENPTILNNAFRPTDFSQLDNYWVKYEGNFKDDNKQGQGVLYLSNNEKYEGEFKNDMIDGVGKFYDLEGEVYQGQWIQNKLQ